MHSWRFRLYKIRLSSALILSLPAALAVLWYGWCAWAGLDRYRRATADAVAVDLELLHVFVHDELDRDLRRLLLADRPSASHLDTIEIAVSTRAIDALRGEGPREGEGSYVKARIRKDGVAHKGRVRYRGRNHWHWLGQQKSMKVRIDKGDLLDGMRVFNLVNDVTPFGLEEDVILDLAREHGLLTPEYRPVWVRLNNADLGVYRYVAQPAEGLIRRAGRMPGSLYSGNVRPSGPQVGVGELFGNLGGWRKAASRTVEKEATFTELEGLLNVVREGSHTELRRYARQHLDLAKMATFDALDIVFGGAQHDFVSNHKYFYDAYRGRFEPVAWNFRAFTHDPVFDRVENPLRLRLKLIPEYLWMRDRRVYELLTGAASAPAVRARVEERVAAWRGDLDADPYWDAYKLLPRVDRFHRFMVRPMSRRQWRLAIDSEVNRHSRRVRYLLDVLERPGVDLVMRRVGPRRIAIEATVGGHAAYALRQVTLSGKCGGRYRLLADADLNGVLEQGRDPVLGESELGESLPLARYHHLLSGIRIVERPDARPKHGTVTAERVARTYRFFVVSTDGCEPDAGMLELDSLVSGASRRGYPSMADDSPAAGVPLGVAEVASAEPGPDETPRLAAGEASPHPWKYRPEPEAEQVVLGPGVVRLSQTVVYEPHQSVRIVRGTRLELGPATSLVLTGPLVAEGTRAAPIDIVASDAEQTFGGIVIIGPSTRGSRLQHVRIRGGSRPVHEGLYTPGLVNIYDTSDITLRAVHVAGARDNDDLLHATYVSNLSLVDVELQSAPSDGIDIELSTAELRNVRIVQAGDECLDLMGSRTRITDSLLIGCSNNAISAGEKTDLAASGMVIADAKVGVLAKNGSAVRISRSLIYRAGRALRTNRREVHYDAPSTLAAEDVYAVDCDEVLRAAKRTRIHTDRVHTALPRDGGLRYVMDQTLSLDCWDQLDSFLKQARAWGG